MCFLCAGIFGWVPAFFNYEEGKQHEHHKRTVKIITLSQTRSWLGSETLYEQVEKALKGGVTLVQLREKNS